MKKDFADLADAGRSLGIAMRDAKLEGVLLAVVPNGVPVALAAAQVCGLPVRGLFVERNDMGVVVLSLPEVEGLNAIVIDDGVETGTVARAVIGPITEAGAASVVLAVPVCPREAMADLSRRYDRVLAVKTPMVRRDLAWHFEDFDTIDEDTATALLGASA